MQTIKIIKSASVLALTLMLSGCGGGGGGGASSVAPTNLNVGDVKSVNDSYLLADGSSINTFKYGIFGGDDVVVEVVEEALVRHYSARSDDVRGQSGEFLLGPGALGRFGWREMRNNGSAAPILFHYMIDRTDPLTSVRPTVNVIENLGSQLTVGAQITVNYYRETLYTAVVTEGGWVRPTGGNDSITVAFGDEYEYRAYFDSNYCSGVQSADENYCPSSSTIAAHSHLWQAEHAALYAFIHDSASYAEDLFDEDHQKNNLGNARFYTYGNLTRRENLPASGELTYDVNALGLYADHEYGDDASLRHGTGTLSANFTTNFVELDLSVPGFLTITDQKMQLSNTHNFFTNENCHVCTGSSIQYTNDSINADFSSGSIKIHGSFYGPEGEEVGGHISHYGYGNKSFQMGFIGQLQSD